MSASRPSARVDYDVVVIGAGFAGLYMAYKSMQLGFTTIGVEAGEGVGGTWFWNRYPGARVDVQSVEYSFSFSKQIQQEWNWTELMAAQPEVEAYLNHVADRLDIRRHVLFSSRVTAMTFDERSATWEVVTDRNGRFRCRFVIAATGCLSVALEPQIPGLETFGGDSLYTSRFPPEGYDFTGKRVAVIGTGSSGVQVIPEIGLQAEHLAVFQRSAAYTRPANNRPFEPGELERIKDSYDDLRAKERASNFGLMQLGSMVVEGIEPPIQRILDTPMPDRIAKLDVLGWDALHAWADVTTDLEANKAATELYAIQISRLVRDPATARSLIPCYPMGCKRQIFDIGYFDTFNRPNVRLVDVAANNIVGITPKGIDTETESFGFDVIVYATGFDAMTGALNRIAITGKRGETLSAVWRQSGPVSYLGLQVAGFPNLFTITGPGSPAVVTNMVVSIEQHVEWIASCLDHLSRNDYSTIEADPTAQDRWGDHVRSLSEGLIRTAPTCNSWYLGSNVPGKKRVYMPYAGGHARYRKECDEIAESKYEGFILS